MLNNRQLRSPTLEAGMPVGSAFTFFMYVVARIVPKHQKRSYPGNADLADPKSAKLMAPNVLICPGLH